MSRPPVDAESPGGLAVLHEDADLVAVSKPPGLPVIPARGEPPGECLRRRLERGLGRRLLVVHRIDRDASGVVAFARNADAHRAMSLAFEHRQVEKTYLAFVAGEPPADEGRIDVALHGARRGKTRPARPGEPGGQDALTWYRVLHRWRREGDVVSLVEARPRTGRHHQIRVHLRSVGAPILFDPLYGRGLMPERLGEEAPCRRLALHAARLELPGRGGGDPVVLEAPLPEDLVGLETWLDREWRGASAR